LHTPIGSKLVFEKWSDGSEEYVAVNLVYQTLDQLQGRTLLSLDVPPMVMPVTINGLTPNSDGLYRLSDLDARMAETMAEYEAIVDDDAVDAPAPQFIIFQPDDTYNLHGQRVETPQRGVFIEGGRKRIQGF